MANSKVIPIKTVEDMAKFDFDRIIVSAPQKMESKTEADGSKKKKSAGIEYHRLDITYKLSDDEIIPLVIRMPQTETSGIRLSDKYFSQAGKPKLSITSSLLTKAEIKFFNKLRLTILKLAGQILFADGENKVTKKYNLREEDFTDESRNFRPFYRDTEKQPGKFRMYYQVRDYTSVHMPSRDKKGKLITERVGMDKITEGKRHYTLKSVPIWQVSNVYLGGKFSIVNYLKQIVVTHVDVANQTSAIDDEINELVGEDYNEEEEREKLAKAEMVSDSDASEDDDDGEDFPRASSSKSKTKRVPIMESDDSGDD